MTMDETTDETTDETQDEGKDEGTELGARPGSVASSGESGVRAEPAVDPLGYFVTPQPVIVHDDQAFVRAATLLRLLSLEGPVPLHVDALLAEAELELTEVSRRQPIHFLELDQATTATTAAEALADVDELLVELRSTSQDLRWTLALTRARSLVAAAAREADTPPVPSGSSGSSVSPVPPVAPTDGAG